MRGFVFACALGAASVAAPIQAAVVNYSTSIVGQSHFTFFTGQPEQSQLTMFGCADYFQCTGSVDLTEGVTANAITHGRAASVGQGVSFAETLPGDFSFEILYSVGGQSVSIVQQARLSRISNFQYQIDFFQSETKTIDLGALGLLDITALAGASQMPQFSSGAPGPVFSRFLLHDAAPAVPSRRAGR